MADEYQNNDGEFPEYEDEDNMGYSDYDSSNGDSGTENNSDNSGILNGPIGDQINKSIKNFSDNATAGPKIRRKAKNYLPQANKKYYKKNKLNEKKIDNAFQDPLLNNKIPQAKLRNRKNKFDKNANKIKDRLHKSGSATGENAKKALEYVEKLENQNKKVAAEMKKQMKIIKRNKMIANAGPYGRLLATILSCKDFCLGQAMVVVTIMGGFTYGILKVFGAV